MPPLNATVPPVITIEPNPLVVLPVTMSRVETASPGRIRTVPPLSMNALSVVVGTVPTSQLPGSVKSFAAAVGSVDGLIQL